MSGAIIWPSMGPLDIKLASEAKQDSYKSNGKIYTAINPLWPAKVFPPFEDNGYWKVRDATPEDMTNLEWRIETNNPIEYHCWMCGHKITDFSTERYDTDCQVENCIGRYLI